MHPMGGGTQNKNRSTRSPSGSPHAWDRVADREAYCPGWRQTRACHIKPGGSLPAQRTRPSPCNTTAPNPAGLQGILEVLHQSYSILLECKSIIQTKEHHLIYFVFWRITSNDGPGGVPAGRR